MRLDAVRLVVGLLLLTPPAVTTADVVYLTSGGKVEGRIVSRTQSTIEVDIGAGSLSFSMSSVARIEEGRSALDDYDERAAALAQDDVDGWLELARWASRSGLGTQASRTYHRVLELDPDNAEANQALGRVELDGRWMTLEESYRARGYVNFEGQWMTPAEQEAIVRGLEAERAEAEAQAASADAMARLAEAEARQAEAEAQQQRYQSPLYWGTWGPGPALWYGEPLDRDRVQPFDRPARQ